MAVNPLYKKFINFTHKNNLIRHKSAFRNLFPIRKQTC